MNIRVIVEEESARDWLRRQAAADAAKPILADVHHGGERGGADYFTVVYPNAVVVHLQVWPAGDVYATSTYYSLKGPIVAQLPFSVGRSANWVERANWITRVKRWLGQHADQFAERADEWQ